MADEWMLRASLESDASWMAELRAEVMRPEHGCTWIEHFYLHPAFQNRGIGGQVLRRMMANKKYNGPFRLNVLQGSPARQLYERNGFRLESEDPVDVFLTAP